MQGVGRVKQLFVVVLKAVVLAPLCQARAANTSASAPPFSHHTLSLQFLWLLDELLYPSYRSVTLHEPLFILAPPRTGSTSLHRALLSDSDRFFAPVTLDLFLPFITLIKLCHFARSRPTLQP